MNPQHLTIGNPTYAGMHVHMRECVDMDTPTHSLEAVNTHMRLTHTKIVQLHKLGSKHANSAANKTSKRVWGRPRWLDSSHATLPATSKSTQQTFDALLLRKRTSNKFQSKSSD